MVSVYYFEVFGAALCGGRRSCAATAFFGCGGSFVDILRGPGDAQSRLNMLMM